MKIGDKVIVTSNGRTYTTNSTAFKDFGFKNTERNYCFENGTIATIFKIGYVNGNDKSAGIRDTHGNESLISLTGIKLYEMQELKITKEKVLEAASKCSTAKATLQTLFPECFEQETIINIKDLADLLNGPSTSIKLYAAIPGEFSIDKANNLHRLIVSTYLKKQP